MERTTQHRVVRQTGHTIRPAGELARALLALTQTPDAARVPVESLLTDSRRHHLAYRDAERHDQAAAARTALTAAATTRAQAELADPGHTDPAWQTEGGTHARGVTSHGEIHAPLLEFYLDWLTH